MKTTIITEYNYPNQPLTRVIHETDGVTLEELLEAFEDHLKGCGFSFEGHLDIHEED